MANNKVICSRSKLTALANKIREKTGIEDTLTIDAMTDSMDSLEGKDTYIDPIEYRSTHRPSDWPYVRLPSEIELQESPTDLVLYTFIELLILEKYGDNKEVSIWSYRVDNYKTTIDWGDGSPIETMTTLAPSDDYVYSTGWDLKSTHQIDWSKCTWCESEGCYATVIKIKIPKSARVFAFRCLPSEISATMDHFINGENSSYPPKYYFKKFGNISYPGQNTTGSSYDSYYGQDRCRFLSFKELTTSMLNSQVLAGRLFLECVSELDCSQVTSGSGYLFYGDISLVTIPELNFDNVVGSVSYQFFNNCTSLRCPPPMSFAQATSISNLGNSSNFTYVPLIKAPNCTKLENLFYASYKLKNVIFDLTYLQNLKQLRSIFSNCIYIENIEFINCPYGITDIYHIFEKCNRLKEVKGFHYHNVNIIDYFISQCRQLVSLNVDDNIAQITSASYPFEMNTRLDIENEILKYIDSSTSTINIDYAFGMTKFPKESFERLPLSIRYSTNLFLERESDVIEIDCSQRTSLQGAFTINNQYTDGGQVVPQIRPKLIFKLVNSKNVVNINSMFPYVSPKEFHMDDASSLTSANFTDSAGNLKSVTMPGLQVSLKLTGCTMDAENLVALFESLGTVSTTQTLTIGTTCLNKLTDAQKAIATDKGWTLA